jgi:large subunit ribosomal protein L1
MKHGKKYLEAIKKIECDKDYSLEEASQLVKELAFAKFTESVDLSVNLQLKKSQSVRDTCVLPNQFQEQKKILVFCKGDKVEEAKAAGATYVGDIDLIDKIRGGWLDFDVAVATPDMMKDVGRLGPILGRKGLMPNPKTQTVTFDVKGALEELQKGRVEFRSDKTGVVHMPIGKIDMDSAKVAENAKIAIKEIIRKKPADAKGEFILSIALSSTMGPGVHVAVKDFMAGL